MHRVKIIGAGLAGSEAAWQCARRRVQVDLYEMRPVRTTPAHQTGDFAELVCSNSLKSDSENTAPWLLKEEMRRAGSLLIEIARLSDSGRDRESEVPSRTEMADPHRPSRHLYFYDSISPIVEADSIDMSKVYLAARYDKGSADYINCP